MKTLIKILKEIRFNAVWLFYAIATQQQRINYMQGQSRGYHVIEAHDEPHWYGGDYYYRYDRSRQPEREYSTYKELRTTWKKLGRL